MEGYPDLSKLPWYFRLPAHALHYPWWLWTRHRNYWMGWELVLGIAFFTSQLYLTISIVLRAKAHELGYPWSVLFLACVGIAAALLGNKVDTLKPERDDYSAYKALVLYFLVLVLYSCFYGLYGIVLRELL